MAPSDTAPRRPPDLLPPLVPVLLPLVASAGLLALLFAHWFPPQREVTVRPAARFVDFTPESGVVFTHHEAAPGYPSPTPLGGGVCVLDYDRDGAPDLFFVNTGAWPWQEDSAPATRPTCALWRNDGRGQFHDVSQAAGVDLALLGMAAAAGDYDGDGWPDLYVTAVGRNRLLRNTGNGRFVDVTAQAGVASDDHTWSTGAAWSDFDGDGRLDLLVCRYARWPEGMPLDLAFRVSGGGRSYGTPTGFTGAPPVLYRNLGDGRFVELGEPAGLTLLDRQTGQPRAQALMAQPLDANHDGRPDLWLTYQDGAHVLLLNRGQGTFREWLPERDLRQEGAAAGWLVPGGFPLAPDASRFGVLRHLLNHDPLHGTETNPADRLPPWSEMAAFACLDYDLDGHMEIVATAARLPAALSALWLDPQPAPPARQFLLCRQADGWHPARTEQGDSVWAETRTSGGLAVADLDGDGDDDVVIAPRGDRARLMRNDQRAAHPWLRFIFDGPAEGLGTRVEVHTPRRIHVQTLEPAIGYLAQSETALTFGLAEDARVRRIVVHWPSGARQELPPPSLHRTHRLRMPR